MNFLIFDTIKDTQLSLVGGKALNLAKLRRFGAHVPNGFVVTTAAFRRYAKQKLPELFIAELFSHFDDLKVDRVAVRSSGVAEDGKNASWAGQFATFLDVAREDLVEKLQACWASTTSAQVKAYQKGDTPALAVAVQCMVASDSAGVLFTSNPITANGDEIIIEAVWGLGELLVQGASIPDNFTISKSSNEVIDQEIAHKPTMRVYQNNSHREVAVPLQKQNLPVLSSAQLNELVSVARDLEAKYKFPLDIEWAYSGNILYILQARPITTL